MTKRNEDREERIRREIIVDAYRQDEQAMVWKIYLEETMNFPLRHAESRSVRYHR
jgi:hypothetical protein